MIYKINLISDFLSWIFDVKLELNEAKKVLKVKNNNRRKKHINNLKCIIDEYTDGGFEKNKYIIEDFQCYWEQLKKEDNSLKEFFPNYIIEYEPDEVACRNFLDDLAIKKQWKYDNNSISFLKQVLITDN